MGGLAVSALDFSMPEHRGGEMRSGQYLTSPESGSRQGLLPLRGPGSSGKSIHKAEEVGRDT